MTSHSLEPAESQKLIDEWLATDIDAWTKEVVRRHFDPETGSPYWLRAAKDMSFDPRDITEYVHLEALGEFDLDVLRHTDPADFVPLGMPRPLAGRVWDSGGTTGSPCRVFYTPEMITHRGVWRWWSFVTEGFEPHRRWLQATPTGPHLIGNGTWEVSALHAGMVYAIDMDSRWVKRLIRTGRAAQIADYTEHLLDQICDALAGDRIDYVNTTPALLKALVQRNPGAVAQLKGVRLSGTQLSPQMYRDFVAALDGGLCGMSYGNTFGNAAGLPAERAGELMPYTPNYPQVTMAVVDKTDWTKVVPVGSVGRVRLTVLHRDLFLPNALERDEAIRHQAAGFPSDGVANVRPLAAVRSAVEGLY
ncbi:arylcarboxylate reductase [Kibdelosporangium aridum]|uniref:arylcarboxylate reductase n=1 Tax=Kibdelosporangium aridum TaxID=2030 RepID=UPI000527561A